MMADVTPLHHDSSHSPAPTGPEPRVSQLCKPVAAVLRESSSISMLDYFIQYMESIGQLHVVQFWLSVESFRSAGIASSLIHNESPMSSGVNQYQNESPVSSGANHYQSPNTGFTLPTNTAGGISEPFARTTAVVPKDTVHHHTNTHTTVDGLTSVGNNHCTTLREEHCSITAPQENVMMSSSHTMMSQVNHQPRCAANPHQHGTDVATKQLSVETDALELYSCYVALNAHHSVGVPDDVRQRIEVSICPEDGAVDRSCFDEAQVFVLQEMENRYYPGFLLSPYLCKYQLEYISSGRLCLLDFLLGENTLFYFMEFMELEGASSLLQFWLTAENFRVHLLDPSHQPDIDSDTTDAISIYERYFSLQASEPLRLGDRVRMDIENKICDEHGPRPDSYTAAQDIAFGAMNETYYPTFLKSSIYLRFLNELVHMLNKDDSSLIAANGSRKHKTDDPTTNSNTGEETDGGCQAVDLDDPDHLWRRPPTLFRLGYVDEYGQYISEADPIPAKTPRQKDHNDSRKFTWLGRRKNEEELAMKITRNIVTEVLNSCSNCTAAANR